jgi:hypothetical protein
MIKLTETSRRILKAIYRGLGVTAISTMFGACIIDPFVITEPAMYGMPPDYREEFTIQGKVISKETGKPIQGIAILLKDINNYPCYSQYDGTFSVYYYDYDVKDNYTLIITDVDTDYNGGSFKQQIITLTREECEASSYEKPFIIELELDL